MASNRSTRDKEMASFLKKIGHERTTAACPNHCGSFPRIGGGALVGHLNMCRGRKRTYKV